MKDQRAVRAGLAVMSFSSGCIDILGYRFLGQVFTSAMTGNLALMGSGLGQGDFNAASRNVSAFAGFVGGLAVGALIIRHGADRRRLFATVVIEAILLLLFALSWRARGADGAVYGLIALAAVAMGLQSAVAHRIGMTGVTTTYFTGTMTNIVFGLVGTAATPRGPAILWPIYALLCYVAGGAVAGWYTAGRSAPELSLVLPALPCAAAISLAVILFRAR